MEGYKLSQQAARDYREILAFTINEWRVNQFEKYASLLDEAFERLVGMPMLGVRRNDIRSGFYHYRVGQHYIFYRIGTGNIEIARILHIKRKVTPKLFSNLVF